MRRTLTGLLPAVLVALVFSAAGVIDAYALVEAGWPAGTPNDCRNSDDFFLNFESGIDEVEIESTIPSMQFTTEELNWKYGDIRTEKYNIYPYGEAAYETNGNFFAWLGTLGDQGRIDFLGGGASYCSVLVSTGSGLTLDAYDSDGTFLATSGWAGNNLATRTFTRLTVEAPAGENIAYVLIHDTGNFWVMDDLCTDANKAVIPVPGRDIGGHGDRFDLVFVPDVDYGLPGDIDTWLPDFIDDIQDQIDQRLAAAAPVGAGDLESFNFYYTRAQGNAATDPHTLPADLTRVAPFADAYSILHTNTFGDWTQWGPPVTFGAEGAVGRSFIHEAGHGIFGLADEYDDAPGCITGRFEPNPMPNVWDTEAECRNDVNDEGWGDPDDCGRFTTCAGGWWKFGTDLTIMVDGDHFANGWGQPASRRIQWFLDQHPGVAPAAPTGPSPEAGKSIWLSMRVSAGVFSLLEESYVVDSPPDYLPVGDAFTVEVFSNGNALLKKFALPDPRIVQAESDYAGPTWMDPANFQLVVPYFSSSGRVDLTHTATGNLQLSVDISQYATALAPEAVCRDIAVALDDNGEAAITAEDVDGGSHDPEGGPVELSIDKSTFTCADLGENSVTLTVTDSEGAPAACTATVTVVDTTPPVLTPPADTTIECDASEDPANTGAATAVDNCDPAPEVEYADAVTPGGCPQEKTITRTWKATDASGNVVSAVQTIEVVDTTPPVITCNAPGTIIPPDAPVSFAAGAADNCDDSPAVAVRGYECFKFTKKGKRIDKGESCVVRFEGDTLTILDSGGVDDHIEWAVSASDSCGNTAEVTCGVLVVNPAK